MPKDYRCCDHMHCLQWEQYNWCYSLFSSLCFTVAVASLEQTNYASEEEIGFVTVCVLLSGQTERSVNVIIATADDTARG